LSIRISISLSDHKSVKPVFLASSEKEASSIKSKFISQTSSLPSASHGECLMAKGMKKKKPKKVESKDKEEDKENDLDFDKLSKKDMIKIKNLFERLQ
jgi:hypothetical protein